ncbi:MAG: FtsX-like permease family protein [Candidatus Lokiarchaeota archaeon]|nr:FtsX-like permease family protein [Candidatus Lokiarchaeota archaeon]
MLRIYSGIPWVRKRKLLTLLCLSLASATAMGISVYVDSCSVRQWDKWTKDPFAFKIENLQTRAVIPDIREIEGVARAASITISDGFLDVPNRNDSEDMRVAGVDSHYLDAYPEVFQIDGGIYPQNTGEVAIERRFARSMNLTFGDHVNYTGESEASDTYHLRVVGIFDLWTSNESTVFDDTTSWYVRDVKALVTPKQLAESAGDFEVHVDIDRTTLTPYNAAASLKYVEDIGTRIRRKLPTEALTWGTLKIGIREYMEWRSSTRTEQILQSSGVILMVFLLDFLAIRYSYNQRKNEFLMLQARGASEREVDRMFTIELSLLVGIGAIIGFFLGVLLSRVAISSTAYFTFNPSLFFSEPFLITVESLLFSAMVGLFIPFMTLAGFFLGRSVEKPDIAQNRKLGKAIRILRRIRWDVLLLIMSGLTLVSLYSLDVSILENPILSTVLSVSPLLLFIAISSLAVKGIRQGASRISSAFDGVFGKLPSSVGIRRVGRSASSGASTAIVLVLAISLAWNMSVLDASLPRTRRNHARFAFGSDMSFHMDEQRVDSWQLFFNNVTSHSMVEGTSLLSKMDASLATGRSGHAELVALDPAEYGKVGYDYMGVPLNESTVMKDLLRDLEVSSGGAIITASIADQYDFSVNDVVRISIDDSSQDAKTITVHISGIVSRLSSATEGSPSRDGGWPYNLGKAVLWVNRDSLASDVNLSTSADNVLCTRLKEAADAREVVNELVRAGGDIVLEEDGWVAVDQEVATYVDGIRYSVSRSVDTMATVGMVLVIGGVFALYASENLRSRKREIALLRSMGGNTVDVVKPQIAELAVLSLFAMLLLIIYAPLLIISNLLTYAQSTTDFPVRVFVVIRWPPLLSIAGFFIGSIIVIVAILAVSNTRINLAQELNAHWAEAGPYRGER